MERQTFDTRRARHHGLHQSVIQRTKSNDERHQAAGMECWCLHGAVGAAADWREVSRRLAEGGIGSRALDLWRFLEGDGASFPEFAAALNAEAVADRGNGRGQVLVGYSMGGRLALHALVEADHPWQAAVIVSAHPGLEDPDERSARRSHDAAWASRAFAGDWHGFLDRWHAQPVLAGSPPRGVAEDRALALRRREIARSFVDWSLGAQAPLWDRLETINVPVLWIAGENDPKFRDLATRAAAATPGSTVAIAPGTGHRVPTDQPAWLAATIAGFLSTCENARPRP